MKAGVLKASQIMLVVFIATQLIREAHAVCTSNSSNINKEWHVYLDHPALPVRFILQNTSGVVGFTPNAVALYFPDETQTRDVESGVLSIDADCAVTGFWNTNIGETLPQLGDTFTIREARMSGNKQVIFGVVQRNEFGEAVKFIAVRR